MTKKICIKIVVVFVAINMILISNIFAVSDIDSDKIEDVKNTESVTTQENTDEKKILSEEEIKQIKELNNIIKELVKGLRSKLKIIDDKTVQIRLLEEYENYPAIRLNIDTPIFGLDSVANSKLKIKQEVSATDIAKGYSIRYIVKNNSIKMPDKYIAGIIVSTKDIKFDDNISLNDANASVLKLMQYTKTVDNTIEFYNNQINKIFKGYIEKTKSENIADIERKLSKLDENLLKQDENLVKLEILSTSEESKNYFEKELEKFDNISKKIKSNKKKISNILISSEDLTKVQKEVLELETNMIDFSSEVEDELKIVKENADIQKILVSVKNEIEERKKVIDGIVDNSITKKEIEEDKNVSNENDDSQEKLDNSNLENKNFDSTIDDTQNKTVEEVINYDIASKNILTSINDTIINNIEQKVNYYIEDDKKDEENKDGENNQKSEEENKLDNFSDEQKENLLNEIFSLYKDYVEKENKFYQDNLNLTLRNTTSKISSLTKYTKSNILEQMRYIYLELPTSLENYIDNNNLNSTLEKKRLSNNLREELNKLLKVYIDVSKIYEELNVSELKNNA